MRSRDWIAGAGRALALALGLCCSAAAGCSESQAQTTDGHEHGDRESTIRFDHSIHAGRYGMACLSCHVYADDSPIAGLPSLRLCMGCHRFAGRDRPAFAALVAAWERREPPTWPRLTTVPDHVYFTHRMHVRANIECSACHGAVERMRTMSVTRSLDMAFCMDCHRRRGASLDCLTCHK